MVDLTQYPAKICLTVAGILIHNHKVLLVKHRKLQMWLAPGGHIEPNELPHRAAEREFWEETGIKATALSLEQTFSAHESQYLPHPFLTNLHWVSQENYQARIKNPTAYRPQRQWAKGCEQHVCFVYMMKPEGSFRLRQNKQETDAIDWFGREQLSSLETTQDVRDELLYAFKWHTR